MPKVKRAELTFVDSAFAPRTATNSSPPSDFVHKLLHHPNPKEAAALVQQYAEDLFMSEEGARAVGLELKIEEIDRKFDMLSGWVIAKATRMNETPRDIQTEVTSVPEPNGERPGNRFTKPDLARIWLYTIALVITLMMGASNVFANLMASGIPVFLDDPWLAVALSALLPAGSIAIKLVSNVLEMPRNRKLYMQFVTGVTCLWLIIWTYLFSKNYTGVAGTLDLASLMNPSAAGWVFVWVQTACELFVSATIFLALDKTLEKYYPPKFDANPEWTLISTAHQADENALKDLSDSREKLHVEHAALLRKRGVFVQEKLADFLAARSRFDRHSSL